MSCAETDQDSIWHVDSAGPKEPRIRWWPRSPQGKGQFLGLHLLCDEAFRQTSLSLVIHCACSEQDVRTEPLYGVVDVNHEIDEDKVYGRLVDLRPNIGVGVMC